MEEGGKVITIIVLKAEKEKLFGYYKFSHSVNKRPTITLTFTALRFSHRNGKKKMKKLFSSSTIHETFAPFRISLCSCGFWYNGVITKNKHNALVESTKILLSMFYSLFFVALFILNVRWGEQEPATIDSFLIKHGWHKLYLIELLFLPIIIWSNFYHRREICECLQLIARYDVVCQVNSFTRLK